jgi:hypothetical protein
MYPFSTQLKQYLGKEMRSISENDKKIVFDQKIKRYCFGRGNGLARVKWLKREKLTKRTN